GFATSVATTGIRSLVAGTELFAPGTGANQSYLGNAQPGTLAALGGVASNAGATTNTALGAAYSMYAGATLNSLVLNSGGGFTSTGGGVTNATGGSALFNATGAVNT